jgi:hypothetical protein
MVLPHILVFILKYEAAHFEIKKTKEGCANKALLPYRSLKDMHHISLS